MLKLCNAVYWLALTIWVSVLIAAGVAATSAFTVLPDRELGVHLRQFERYDSAHHGRIAAGRVMEPIFTFVDVITAPAAAIALLMLILQLTLFRMPWRSPANFIRTLALAIAVGLFAWRALSITPEMNRDLRAYWDAAEAGDVARADRHLSSFNENHPRANLVVRWSLVLLLTAVAASASAMSTAPAVEPKRASDLEPPKLARKT